jgi:predicted transposase YbfD/YdcC
VRGAVVAGRCRGLAVDGKTLRGSRRGAVACSSTNGDDAEEPGRHLLVVIDHHARVVLGQLAVAAKSSEVLRLPALLDTRTGLDLTGAVITADAPHTQRPRRVPARPRRALGVHGQGHQPRLRRQLAALPWREVEVAHRDTATAHDRREIRTLKVVTLAAGIAFPHARQVWSSGDPLDRLPCRRLRRGGGPEQC